MKIVTARPHRLLEECVLRIGELERQGKECMFLVPSQYTLQAEIEVMTRLQLRGSFSIDVLSPGRLRTRVFERAGEPDRIVFDERGKCMVLRAIIEEEKENLKVYRASAQSGGIGLAQKMSAIIADMKRSGLTPEDLAEKIKVMEDDNPARAKLEDVLRIFAQYESRMKGRLADAEDISRIVHEKMKRSGVLKGQHMLIYGFDMITPSFASDILKMAPLCESLTLAVETDKNGAPDGRLFAPVNASIDRLCTQAKEQGIPVEREVIAREIQAKPEICVLEKNLFALGTKPYEGEVNDVSLRAVSTPRMEVHLAAGEIRRMIHEGEDPADIAIVYPKNSGYAPLMESILPMYDLPVYAAQKRAASSHPLFKFILSSLAVVSEGWRTADVIECVQTGFIRLEQTEADALCAYAEGVDLRKEDWKHPFAYIKNGDQEELEQLNKSRETAVQPLISLENGIRKAKTADEAVMAVMSLLDDVQVFDTLENMRNRLLEEGLDAQAEDCAQVSIRLMETLDQMHTLLGDETISARVVLDMLSSGIAALELGALPPADGAVICGEIGNIRTAQVGTIFAVGMNDASAGAENGLLSPAEKEEAAKTTGAYLGMSAAERAALSQLDTLKVLSGAGKRLYVSYAVADETGRALREGDAVQAMKRIFPGMKVDGGLAREELENMLCAPKPALQALSVMLSDAVDEKAGVENNAAQAYAALCTSDNSKEALKDITKRLGEPNRAKLDVSQARTLYGRPVMSVSRLEAFAQCPYRHFVRYGLSPQEENKPGVDRAELGTLYHEAAERFTRAVTALSGFPNVPDEVCDKLMDEAAQPLIEEWRKSPLGKSARGGAIAQRIGKIARRTGRNIVSQFAGGSFAPMRSELVFGQNGVSPIMMELADGTMIYLQGRIDRVDILDEEKRIRVIDYKSGTKKFDPTMVFWGLQLQLLIYLAAALSQIPGSKAGGFFYCRIADPTIQSESRIKEEIEKQIARKLSLAGISLSDVSILRAQGNSHAAMITKEGKANGRYAASMVDEEGMENLLAFAKRKAASIAQDVYAGMIDDSPAERGQYVACSSCAYAAICGFDPARKKRRRLTEKKIGDITGQG